MIGRNNVSASPAAAHGSAPCAARVQNRAATARKGPWRTLHVGDHRVTLRADRVAALYERGIVYDCGDGHDLHLDPVKQDWDVDDIETLMLAVAS